MAGPRLVSMLFLLTAAFAAACGDEPAASTKDATGGVDTGETVVLDAGFLPDAVADSGVHPDAAPADTGAPEDTGVAPDSGAPEDTGVAPDTGALDAGGADAEPDAAVGDTGTGADAAVPFTDTDGDNIADSHEGNGLVDTDMDGMADTVDPDSDNDGIPDVDEAGDADPATPPRDSDGDGTPDFRDTDSDNDGIPDAAEGAADPDNDGIPNHLDTDNDGDTIRDVDEGTGDPDGDSIPNHLDPDSDGDGILDLDEAGDASPVSPAFDSDNDGTPDFLDIDSDNDFISDADEGNADPDNDQLPNRVDIDSDNDSILDLVEAGDGDLMTPPIGSDGDGIPDFLDTDSDGDTISDLHERALDDDNDGTPNYLDADSDNDGFPDAVEAGDADLGTAPINSDTDFLPDFIDIDSDADGLLDANELGCPASTARTSSDSDLDGFVDPAEIAYGSNPCDGLSGIDDFYFVLPPLGPGAGAPLVFSDTSIDRADLAINVDNTGSMGGEITNLRNSLSNTIIPGVRAVIPDSGFGVTSFEDFPIDPFGDATDGDLPFRLRTRVTLDSAVAQSAVNALTVRNGVDFPESGLESIWQILTGLGTTFPGGSVPAFNPADNLVPGVADGTIGGVGFRNDALPIVVHITDAVSHSRRDYQAVNAAINAASVTDVRNGLASAGARVVTISSGIYPFDDLLCSGGITTWFAGLDANDVDWFLLQGATAGQSVTVDTYALAYLSGLDTMAAIASSTGIIAQNDDIAPGNTDSRVTATLSGTGPFYIAVAAYGDAGFAGTGGLSTGHYLVDVTVGGTAFLPSPTACRAEDGNTRGTATALVTAASAVPPADFAGCVANCDAVLGGYSPLFQDFTFPYELSEETNAVIPPCAWSEFGTRPAGCAADQCCTGVNGTGVPVNAAGQCPLAFEIDATGAGLDAAMVTGVQALVSFSTFTVTTVVRPDPIELVSSGIDTTCFIHGVVPTNASASACAPAATIVDLVPPSPEPDSFENVVPGTVLTFQVDALNQDTATSLPCADALPTPRLFRAYIDVVADGVTVVDTRDVIIIVPPVVPGGGN